MRRIMKLTILYMKFYKPFNKAFIFSKMLRKERLRRLISFCRWSTNACLLTIRNSGAWLLTRIFLISQLFAKITIWTRILQLVSVVKRSVRSGVRNSRSFIWKRFSLQSVLSTTKSAIILMLHQLVLNQTKLSQSYFHLQLNCTVHFLSRYISHSQNGHEKCCLEYSLLDLLRGGKR